MDSSTVKCSYSDIKYVFIGGKTVDRLYIKKHLQLFPLMVSCSIFGHIFAVLLLGASGSLRLNFLFPTELLQLSLKRLWEATRMTSVLATAAVDPQRVSLQGHVISAWPPEHIHSGGVLLLQTRYKQWFLLETMNMHGRG